MMARVGVKILVVALIAVGTSGCAGLVCRDEVARPLSRENYFCGPSAHQTNADETPGESLANRS